MRAWLLRKFDEPPASFCPAMSSLLEIVNYSAAVCRYIFRDVHRPAEHPRLKMNRTVDVKQAPRFFYEMKYVSRGERAKIFPLSPEYRETS